MRDRTLDKLQQSLLESGVAPCHVRRIVLELHDHIEDLRQEALADGCDPDSATDIALHRIGDPRLLASRFSGMRELRTWVYRYPGIARIYYPIAYVLLLPVVPVFAGMAHASILVRWGAALLLSATLTAAMFLAMQIAIALG